MAMLKIGEQAIWDVDNKECAVFDNKEEAEEKGTIEDSIFVDVANEPSTEKKAFRKLYMVIFPEAETETQVVIGEVTITIKPASELPGNASVALHVLGARRFVRWTNGDASDELPPTVLYSAPGWVWELYQQGRNQVAAEHHARHSKEA